MNELYLNGATIMTTPTPRQLEVALAAGFAGLEVRTARLCGSDNASELKATIAAVTSSGAKILNIADLALHTGPDGIVDQKRLEAELPEILDLTNALNAPYLGIVPVPADGVSFEQVMPSMRDALAYCLEQAGPRGIKLGFEFLGFANDPVNTAAKCVTLLETLPEIGFVPDSCHIYASHSRFSQIPADRIPFVHFNDCAKPPSFDIQDGDRVLPSDGQIPLGEYLRELRAGGFTGPISLETFTKSLWDEDPAQLAVRAFKKLQAVVNAAGGQA
jgi:2-keto-myo-inositol isomerase